jgi:hypothetical protein
MQRQPTQPPRPKLLDLFCGAGGAAMGYYRAGFQVYGVDKEPQPNYPFEFEQADALTFPIVGYDAIHASPPCQAHSTIGKQIRGRIAGLEHPDLVEPTRELLRRAGKPFVIDSVGGPALEVHTGRVEYSRPQPRPFEQGGAKKGNAGRSKRPATAGMSWGKSREP